MKPLSTYSAALALVLAVANLQERTRGPRVLRADEIRFNSHIRPLLSDRCFSCHGPDEKHREADLRLDLRDGATGDAGGPVAIVPGKPADSELLKRVTSIDPDTMMPP